MIYNYFDLITNLNHTWRFNANDGAFTLFVDVKVTVWAPANAEDASRSHTIVAVTFEPGQTLALMSIEHFVVGACGVGAAIGCLFARF